MNMNSTEQIVSTTQPENGAAVVRHTVEFLAALAMCVVAARTFAVEAYVVPTGSMAPTLLGVHREATCSNCRFRFVVGVDDEGRSGRLVCPNCGQDRWDRDATIECDGDRLLVQKYLYEFRSPRRWEVVVFQSPHEPSRSYVKRVVGLPGEFIQIVAGDIYINGSIARKTLSERRAARVLVYDNDYPPADANKFPRWTPRRGSMRGPSQSGWGVEGAILKREPVGESDSPIKAGASNRRPRLVDWLEYHHWAPDRTSYGPIRDFYAYNGGDLTAENHVDDLMFEGDFVVEPGVDAVWIRLIGGGGRQTVRIPVDRRGAIEATTDGRSRSVKHASNGMESTPPGKPKWRKIEVSTFDREFTVMLDGKPILDPIVDDAAPGFGKVSAGAPLAIGVEGTGRVIIRGVKLYRDLYYTPNLLQTPKRSIAVEKPYKLGADEYFVLGDNSPISNDSRFWPKSPVIHGDDLIGKPFLVHLPSQAAPLKVFGRATYWIPDPTKIRYVR